MTRHVHHERLRAGLNVVPLSGRAEVPPRPMPTAPPDFDQIARNAQGRDYLSADDIAPNYRAASLIVWTVALSALSITAFSLGGLIFEWWVTR